MTNNIVDLNQYRKTKKQAKNVLLSMEVFFLIITAVILVIVGSLSGLQPPV